ncbi:MAG: efflux RND transporter periplasmic adaptor subunit [Deltaproteobacteria bacterium]|nr:efflux RND transporter periplasmic adaptor subunit [Deltaproteobacteria bacterium]
MKITINPFGKVLLTFFMAAALLWGAACTGKAPSGSAEKGHEAQKETPGATKDPKDLHGKGEKKEHAGEDGHGDEKAIRLTEAQLKEFGIELATAGPGPLKVQVELPGEIVPNADRVAHVVPRVPGVVREVRKVLGDRVRKGEVLVVLDSKELADNKAAFLSAGEKLEIAQSNFAREEDLWKKKISPAQDYLQAKQALAEARIEFRSAEQKLHALGFSDAYMSKLPSHPDESYTRYEIVAPFEGTVIEKHVALGEAHKEDADLFRIADLSSVWVNLGVYQKDIPSVRVGQPVVISAGHGIPDMTGEISYVGPLVGEQTRTATARVVLPNRGGQLRPGLFVTGSVTLSTVPVPILVSKTALLTIDEKTVVFVEDADGFEARAVTIGRSNGTHMEITSGLKSGQKYVSAGAFTLKAQLAKGSFGDGHNH